MKAKTLYSGKTIFNKKGSKYGYLRSIILLCLIYFVAPALNAQTITTFAGMNNVAGNTGNGGPATAATLSSPWGITFDGSGNTYISANAIIRKINTSGIISVFAGDGVTTLYSGEGGPATAATLYPLGLAADAAGNIYAADVPNNRVYMINTAGVITTIAGTGTGGFNSDGVPATAANLAAPIDVAVDASGNVYIADQSNHRIRMVNTSGIISTVAGNGISGNSGDGGPATAAMLNNPTGVELDNAGNLYISDNGNIVRKVTPAGIISTVAGTIAGGFGGDGGPATAAAFAGIGGVVFDNFGNMFISDANNNRIRKVNAAGIINTIAGNGTPTSTGDGGPATAATLITPLNLEIDNSGNLYVVDGAAHVARNFLTNNSPSFVGGSPQSLAVCENSGATSINSLLAVNDADAGQTETWSVVSGPSNGTLAAAYSTTSTGGTLTPTGLTFTPNTGYDGVDAFTIQVDDGNGGTATTTVNVTVNPIPVITPSANTAICLGNSTTLSAIGGATYSWSPAAGLSATTGASVTANPTTTTTYTITGTSSFGCSSTTSVTVTVNPVPSVTLSAIPAICAGTTSATQAFTGATEVISKSAIFGFSGTVQTWTVPTGITSITVDAYGAAGGLNSDNISYPNREGFGARVQTALAVTPGQVLNINVGGKGFDGLTIVGGPGGYNGGGNGSFGFPPFAGGGGGGATDIRIGGTALTDRVVVAAGGGGAGLNCGTDNDRGGDGGGLTGEDGVGNCGIGGTGGTTSFGGVPGGMFGTGGDGMGATAGGGGGGGYYGGGGGSWAGGGGASSYTDALLSSSVTHIRGMNSGAGMVTITYQIPTTYSIVWSPAAILQGFNNVSGSSVTASPISVAVPGSAVAATYTGTLTMTNSITGCVTTGNAMSLTINPIPDVSPVSSQTVCNTVSTTAVTFATTVPGTVFNWTNPNPGIGIVGAGTGNIPSFTAVNTSFVPVTTVFTVTPTRLGCVGPIETFSITVNPTPNVAASSNQAVCNGSSTTAINFTGPVAGTTYSWTNDNTSIGLASSSTGNIASFTGTNSTTATETGVITVSTSANGCSGGSNSFTITVYPTPVLTSGLNPPAICDNTLFSYMPTSATTGTTFDWSRDAITGISNPANSGTDDPNEVLNNITTDPINVAYVYTLTANGCTNSQTVTVVVNPTPMLTSLLTPAAICDSTEFAYMHTSLTAGTTYSWSRDVVTGISNPAQSGIGDISEYLDNTTPNPIPVTYMDTLMANGCVNIQAVTVTVNPKPELSTATVLSAICDSSSIFYVPNSLTTGTTYAWDRTAIAGTPAATGIDTISGTLYNNTVSPITVIHTYTLTANGCTNTQDVTIVVYPTPKLSSSLAPPALCDSQIFNYTPMSGTLGSAFAWSRPFVLGMGMAASSGTGNPNEQMINNTHGNLNVTYVYTTTANGCTHVQHVVVAVRPTPRLSTPLTGSVCSGVNYHYKPTGYTFGSTFAWARANVASITPNTGSGTGVIDEVLVNATLAPITVAYTFTVTANSCSHKQNLVVTVNPAPAAMGITTYPPSDLCTNTIGQNFGTSSVPPAGQQYNWSTTNATVWATGEKGQYCLVNFDKPGEAWVTLSSNVTGIACITKSSYKVNVGTGISGMPKVVYFDGQLVCLDPTQESYQWGFDDGLTLDSTIVAGEKNPNYFISGPDFIYRHYWVITEKDGCMQKSYYNTPLAISEVSADVANIKLYPNPANSLLNVEIQTTIDGAYELDVVNLLGQTLYKEKMDGQRARVDVTNFASGIYLVDCYRNGVKIATQRFIKN